MANNKDVESDKESSNGVTILEYTMEMLIEPEGKGVVVDILTGKRFVLTGTSSNHAYGWEEGRTIEKFCVRTMIESFGGTVASGVSGLTYGLVTGKNPGKGKVTKENNREMVILNMANLQKVLLGEIVLNFSNGKSDSEEDLDK